MPDVHSICSASSSHAWINCAQYLKMQELFPDTPSPYAAAGTLAHSIAELKARTYFLEPLPKRSFNAKLKKLQEDPAYDKEMDAATDMYLDALKEKAMSFAAKPFIALEVQVRYDEYAPEGFGTSDCIMVGEGRVVVVDYKNGAGVPVSAEYNSQMMLYALGALQTFRPIYGDTIKTAEMMIVQPHAGGVKEWSISVDELLAWGHETVAPAAQRALAGEDPAQPGAHCRFCRGKAQCRERIKEMLSLEAYNRAQPDETACDGPTVTDEEIGDILTRGEALVEWYNSLKDYALQACLAGRNIPGYKAVEGRSLRAWGDVDAAFAALQQRDVSEAVLYERKPVSVAALEKILGKKIFAEVAAEFVVTPPGKPTLVSEKDKRPAYNAAAVAFGGAVNG